MVQSSHDTIIISIISVIYDITLITKIKELFEIVTVIDTSNLDKILIQCSSLFSSISILFQTKCVTREFQLSLLNCEDTRSNNYL